MSEIEKICENCKWEYEDEFGKHCRNCIHNAEEHFKPKEQKRNVRLIDINNEKFWDILFNEACVEGQQAERIEKELNEIVTTAYDVDKVVEKLTKNLNSVETELANLKEIDVRILLAEREHLIGKKLAYATAIDIIRKGGIE